MEDERAQCEVSHVCVAVRCRPMSDREAAAGGKTIVDAPEPGQLLLHHSKEDHRYSFDHVFDPQTSQEQIFEILGVPQLEKAFDGYNCTIFAYGQTGSGKTHTMMNYRAALDEQGLIPRIGAGLYQRIDRLKQEHQGRRFLVQCSFLEIYNEIIYDLLVPRGKDQKGGGLEVKEQKGIGIYVKDLREVVVENPDRLGQLIEEGLQHRSTASTKMNDTSSRSHCIFTIRLHQKDAEDDSKNTFSKVNLVDLAGSERAKATEAEGERLKEGSNINKSLSALGNVINALSSMARGGKKVFVPYRNSKLTRVLQESLGGNSLCTMVAAVSPSSANADETLSTLNYARRAKTIKVTATKNEEASVIKKLEEEIEALRQKLTQEAGKVTQVSVGLKEQQELESKHQAQIELLNSFITQSWEDKQKISEQYEEERKIAQAEVQRAADQVRNEQRRRLQLLEQNGDIQLTLQALKGLSANLCSVWPEKITDALKTGQLLRSQLRAVKLFRDSAGVDFSTWWSHRDGKAASVLTLLNQVHTKLESMSTELSLLVRLESQMKEHLGLIAPEVALALREARQATNKAEGLDDETRQSSEELVQVLSLVQRQLAQHQVKEQAHLQEERQRLAFKVELEWLSQCLQEGSDNTATRTSQASAHGSLVDELREEVAAMSSPSVSEDAGVLERPQMLPDLLGLSTFDLPDDCLRASSNDALASGARLLQMAAYGGWCPTADSAQEYLEVDLRSEMRVIGLSLQGRIPCSGKWLQTRALLQLALRDDERGRKLLNVQEKVYVRPPVRFIHDIALALAPDHDCLGQGKMCWQLPPEYLDYEGMTREQKVMFLDDLIRRTHEAWGWPGSECMHAALSSQDILSGRNCEESNRLLQMLAYFKLVPRSARSDSGGLGDVRPHWTTRWKMEYYTKQAGWRWHRKQQGDDAEDSAALDGNVDACSVKFAVLPEPVVASKLRIYPLEWHLHAGLRCEVHVTSNGSETKGEDRAAGTSPWTASRGLKGSVDLACRGVLEIKSGIERMQFAKQRRKSALKEQADQERDEMEQRLKDALTRVQELEVENCTMQTGLLQMQAENERLHATLEQLEAELASGLEARSRLEDDCAQLRCDYEELESEADNLAQQVQVLKEERDTAQSNEEELFDLVNAREEELAGANTNHVYLTERLQEKELENFSVDLLVESMDMLSGQVHELECANGQLEAEKEELSSQLRDSEAERGEILSKLREMDLLSEKKRQRRSSKASRCFERSESKCEQVNSHVDQIAAGRETQRHVEREQTDTDCMVFCRSERCEVEARSERIDANEMDKGSTKQAEVAGQTDTAREAVKRPKQKHVDDAWLCTGTPRGGGQMVELGSEQKQTRKAVQCFGINANSVGQIGFSPVDDEHADKECAGKLCGGGRAAEVRSVQTHVGVGINRQARSVLDQEHADEDCTQAPHRGERQPEGVPEQKHMGRAGQNAIRKASSTGKIDAGRWHDRRSEG